MCQEDCFVHAKVGVRHPSHGGNGDLCCVKLAVLAIVRRLESCRGYRQTVRPAVELLAAKIKKLKVNGSPVRYPPA